MSSRPRRGRPATIGTVSMVLATAMSSSAVKVSLLIRPLSSSTLTNRGRPYQRGVPAIALGECPHEAAEQPAGCREYENEARLPPAARPVHENDREHSPDGEVIETSP